MAQFEIPEDGGAVGRLFFLPDPPKSGVVKRAAATRYPVVLTDPLPVPSGAAAMGSFVLSGLWNLMNQAYGPLTPEFRGLSRPDFCPWQAG